MSLLGISSRYYNASGALIRAIPAGSAMDTIIGLPGGGIASIHYKGAVLFQDDEILGIDLHPMDYKPPTWGVTRDGRSLVQQVGFRGCIAACASMMQLDRGVEPDRRWLESCNLEKKEHAVERLVWSGLAAMRVRELGADIPRRLEELIGLSGGILLGISGELGSHVIILDEVDRSEGMARIREPFHGWSITVQLESLLQRVGYLSAVRVQPYLER